MIILIHNTRTQRMERYERNLREPMPHANGTLLVGEFRGSSRSNLLWSTSSAMEAWVATRRLWGRPIYLPYAFKRVGEGGHGQQSQHYAGTAFDCAQNIGGAQRALLRQLAENSGLWSYVEPAYLTPTWVHFDKRLGPPACAGGGYPVQRRGNWGVYVCVLQDALNVAARAGLTIDGNFGSATADALGYFQAVNRLTADAVAGCATWATLMRQAVGMNPSAQEAGAAQEAGVQETGGRWDAQVSIVQQKPEERVFPDSCCCFPVRNIESQAAGRARCFPTANDCGS